jgi:hypothetical protein
MAVAGLSPAYGFSELHADCSKWVPLRPVYPFAVLAHRLTATKLHLGNLLHIHAASNTASH